MQQTGPVSYKCVLPSGNVVRRHQDQILNRSNATTVTTPIKTFSPNCDRSANSPVVSERADKSESGAEVEAPSLKHATPVRRFARVVKPPDRLDL